MTLPIKKQWFDMILSGEKKEEYREIKKYYIDRFIERVPDAWDWEDGMEYENFCRELIMSHTPYGDVLDLYDCRIKKPKEITIVNGYGKNRPRVTALIDNIYFGRGKEKWGAEPGVNYFVIKIKGLKDAK